MKEEMTSYNDKGFESSCELSIIKDQLINILCLFATAFGRTLPNNQKRF